MVHEGTFVRVKGKGKLFPVQAIMHICTAEVQLHSLTSALDAGNWLSSHPSHCISRKELQYPLTMTLGGHQSWSAHIGKEKNLSSVLGFTPQTVQPIIAHSPHPPHTRTPISLLVFQKFLEPKGHFTMKINIDVYVSCVCVGFISETLPYRHSYS